MSNAARMTGVAIWLAAGAAWSYSGTRTSKGDRVTWCERSVSFFVHEAGSRHLSLEESIDAVVASFNEWAGQSCSGLRVELAGLTDADTGFDSSGNNQNVVIWRETEEDWRHDPRAIGLTTVTFCVEPGGLCKRAGAILDADVELNGAWFTFTVGDEDVRYDVRNTMTHEVGHVLGFEHSSIVEATMFGQATPGEVRKRTLHADDLRGMCETYGVETPACVDEREAAAGIGCRAAGAGGGWGALLGFVALAAFSGRRRGRSA